MSISLTTGSRNAININNTVLYQNEFEITEIFQEFYLELVGWQSKNVSKVFVFESSPLWVGPSQA